MTLADVLSRIQQLLTAWEGGIRATGGAIEPKKSHWYLVDFDWKDGDPYYRNISETGGQLRVRDLNGKLQTLTQMEPWQAERTLGVRIAPDGNMETQFDWMLDTAQKWAEKIRSSPSFNLVSLAINYSEDAGISLDNNNFIQEAV
jgi:hypothetical protein